MVILMMLLYCRKYKIKHIAESENEGILYETCIKNIENWK
jgi:hypothetical protein